MKMHGIIFLGELAFLYPFYSIWLSIGYDNGTIYRCDITDFDLIPQQKLGAVGLAARGVFSSRFSSCHEEKLSFGAADNILL